VGEMYLWSLPTINQRSSSALTICETDQRGRKHLLARTYVGELLIALVIIRAEPERFRHDLKVCEHITQQEFRGHPHWPR
jgi:hypothetical protein